MRQKLTPEQKIDEPIYPELLATSPRVQDNPATLFALEACAKLERLDRYNHPHWHVPLYRGDQSQFPNV